MKDNNPYLPEQYAISSIKEFTEDTRLFKVKAKMPNMPGQFVNVSLSGIGECPISICSYSKGYLELLIRNVGNVTNAIFKLKKGDKIGIRGAYGHGYPMEEMRKKDIVIIAGGTGAAPPRSVIGYIKKNRKLYKSLNIYLGFKSPGEILFKEDIEEWQKEFNVTLTVDKCADPNYNGRVCFVTEAVGDVTVPPNNAAVVMCGPPIMMKAATEKLKAKGFEDKQIYVSYERHMKCGFGKCGHCVISGKYVCKDGPVFRYDVAKEFAD
jgi:anaerobic sulfite reductase subunit B